MKKISVVIHQLLEFNLVFFVLSKRTKKKKNLKSAQFLGFLCLGRFKDHKRCSHMIAKELDSDVAVTAAQVSRKLKKLGLRTSRMKSEVKSQNMDEAYTDEEDDSDNLTLSLVRKR